MDNFEVLGYVLKANVRLEDFLVFCVSGTPGDPTEPGVYEWLYSRPVVQAHFFTSRATDSLGVFGVTLLQPSTEPGEVPWTDKIKGFEKLVSMNGALSRVHAAPGALSATLASNQYLNDKFSEGAKPIADIFAALKSEDRSGFSFTTEQFQAALQGSAKVDRQAILAEIEDRLGRPLFEKADLAKIRESLA